MFAAYVAVTVLAAAANALSATLDFIRYKQILINMAKVGVSESWITILGILKSSGRAWTPDRHWRAVDRDNRRSLPRPVLCRCHHHPPARTRLLVRSGTRVPSAGGRRAGVETNLVVSNEMLEQVSRDQ